MKQQRTIIHRLPIFVIAALALTTASLAQNRLHNGSFEVSHNTLGAQKLTFPTLQHDDLDYWCFHKDLTEIWTGFGATNGRTAVLTIEPRIQQTFNLFGCRDAMSSPFTRMPNVLLFDALAQRNSGQPHFSTTPNVSITDGISALAWNFTPIGTAPPINGWRTLARVFGFNPSDDCQTLGFNDNFYNPTNGRVLFDNFYLFNCRDFDPLLPQTARGYTATNGTATDGHIGNMFSLGDSRVVKLASGTSKQCGIIVAGYVDVPAPTVFSMTYDIARDPDCGPVYAYVSIYDFVNQRWRGLNPSFGLGPLGYPIGTASTYRLNTVSTSLANHAVTVPLPLGGKNLVLWKIEFTPYKQPPIEPFPGSPPAPYPCLGVAVDRIQVY